MDETQKKATISFTIPSWFLAVTKVVDYAAQHVSESVESIGEVVENKKPKFKMNPPKFNTNNLKESFVKIKSKMTPIFGQFVRGRRKYVVALLVILVVGGFGMYRVGRAKLANKSFSQVASAKSSSSLGQVSINNKFDVPIKGQDGKDTGENLHVTITDAEKSKDILIQGRPASAKDGKAFLIINMEIGNETKKSLTVQPVDLVRLVDSQGKNYAADVYNNDVSAEPLSIRKSRIGYVVDESNKSFKLLIGEVRVKQQPIVVNF